MEGLTTAAWIGTAGLSTGLGLFAFGALSARPVEPVRRRIAVRIIGGMLLAAGFYAAMHAVGPEAGIPVWLGLAGLLGFPISLLFARKRGGTRTAHRAPPPRQGARPADRRLTAALAAIVIPGSLIASLTAMLALPALLPLAPAEKALTAFLLWPPLATTFLLHASVQAGPRRAAISLGAATLLAALIALAPFL